MSNHHISVSLQFLGNNLTILECPRWRSGNTLNSQDGMKYLSSQLGWFILLDNTYNMPRMKFNEIFDLEQKLSHLKV